MVKGGIQEFLELRNIVDTFPECPTQDIWGLCPTLDKMRIEAHDNEDIKKSVEEALKLSTIYLN